ncbi:glutathione transferase GstA [Hydrogenophaga sp. PAMC20947]|uniref:glutathione transferase GstA n=1 Tax=Hydrogenophaga sp. PAMC20947 TaxID=2565558 RepID=UPI00109DAF82|nr:glutathione transferase GstA [Hydrogenophaga sp. PAMC20947]QCB47594.1 glutathione transferase GstA [Hydrogenophaga sp. PAMC20947]
MKLYYSPGACSLSVHIALHEAGLSFEAIKAPTQSKILPDGSSYLNINPLGYVPCLELANGDKLLEGPAIVQYIADLAPEKNLAPTQGTMARLQLQSWLNFIATEVHKGFSPLTTPGMPDDMKTLARDRLMQRLQWVNGELAGKQYLMGDTFTVADGYLFTVSGWPAMVGMDLSGLTHLGLYRARVGARAGVQAAMRAEGLI